MGDLEQLLGSLAELVDLELNCSALNWVCYSVNVDVPFVCQRVEHCLGVTVVSLEGVLSALFVPEDQVDPVVEVL